MKMEDSSFIQAILRQHILSVAGRSKILLEAVEQVPPLELRRTLNSSG